MTGGVDPHNLTVMPDDGRPPVRATVFRAHPWHGVPIGDDAPRVVTTYIEIVPTDTVKYEIDKLTGILAWTARSSTRTSARPSTASSRRRLRRAGRRLLRGAHRPQRIVGDGDPMDVCVLTEKPFSHGDILLQSIPIGGLRMIDGDEADDKIVAVLEGDAVYGQLSGIADCPAAADRTAAALLPDVQAGPGSGRPYVEITHVYGRDEAHEVIRRSREDYVAHFADL